MKHTKKNNDIDKLNDIKSAKSLIFGILFLINVLGYLVFRMVSKTFPYDIPKITFIVKVCIIILNSFSILTLLFIKKLYKVISLYTAITMSSFSLYSFLAGLSILYISLDMNSFILTTVIWTCLYILIILLSINHMKSFYSTKKVCKPIKNQAKLKLIVIASCFVIFLAAVYIKVSRNLINASVILLLGCMFAVCYSHFYKFYILNSIE